MGDNQEPLVNAEVGLSPGDADLPLTLRTTADPQQSCEFIKEKSLLGVLV